MTRLPTSFSWKTSLVLRQRDIEEGSWKQKKNRDVFFLYPSFSPTPSPLFLPYDKELKPKDAPPLFPLRFAPGRQRPQSDGQGRWGRVDAPDVEFVSLPSVVTSVPWQEILSLLVLSKSFLHNPSPFPLVICPHTDTLPDSSPVLSGKTNQTAHRYVCPIEISLSINAFNITMSSS